MRLEPSFVRLDGTLVESVYQHVFPGGLHLMREDRALGLAYSSQDRHERAYLTISCCARLG
jgi:hypothetical protein